MFKNIKIGFLAIVLLLVLAPTSFCETWPNFHNGNTLIKGKLNVTDQIVFTGGRTVMETVLPGDIIIRSSGGPVSTITIGGTGNAWQVLQMDGGAGSSDDFFDFPWVVPDGYVTDSLRYNIFWSCESAETASDTVTFDGTVLSVASGEAVDSTVTAMTSITDTQWTGTADLVFKTVINPEVVVIAIDDVLYTTISVDESESGFTDTVDIHYIQREWESTE